MVGSLRESLLSRADRRTTVVVGEPGAGKSVLLAEATAGTPVVLARPRRGDAAVPLALVRGLLGPEVVAGALDAVAPEALAGALGVLLHDVLAARVVVVDDLHEVDPLSLDVLAAAMAGPRPPRVLAASRPWTAERYAAVAAFVGRVEAEVVQLAPFTDDEIARLVAAHRGCAREEVDPGEIAELARRTGGNALLLGASVSRGPVDSAAEYVTRELAALPEETRGVARAIAVLGGVGTIADVVALSGVAPGALAGHLRLLDDVRLLDPDGDLRIRHPLLEELVAGSAGPLEERRLHGEAARLWARRPERAADLVGALQRSLPLGEPWAAASLLAAAADAWRLQDADRCLALCDRAEQESVGEPEVSAGLLHLRAEARLHRDGDDGVPAAEATVARLREAGDWQRAAEVRLALINHGMMRFDVDLVGRHAAAIAEELAEPAHGGSLTWRARITRGYLAATYVSADPMPADRLAVIDAAGDLLHAAHPEALRVAAYAAAAYAQAGRDEEAVGLIDHVRRHVDLDHVAHLVEYGLAGTACVHLGRLDIAREIFGTVRDLGRTAGVRVLEVNAEAWLALLDAWDGVPEAAASARRCLAAPELWPPLVPVASAAVLEAALAHGDDAALAAAAAEADVLAPMFSVLPGVAFASWWLCRARVSLALGAVEDAAAQVEAAARAYGGSDWLCPLECVAEEVALARRVEPARHEPPAAWLRRPEIVAWRQALVAEPGALGEPDVLALPVARRWEVLLAAASRWRRAGRTSEARELLRAVRAGAERAGLVRVAALASAELLLAGGRRRAVGAWGLTPAEERVALLAAGGAGNREIAGALNLSVRTVENHMARVLAKVGVARAELADRLG